MARKVSVAIVGAGFGGVATAVRLEQQGQDDIVILERGERIGGVWRANVYPGIACDVPSHLYSLSFAPNPDWSERFSPGGEIHAYLEGVADRFGVTPHIRFNADVERATFDEGRGRWRLEVANGEDVEAEVLITACGQLPGRRSPPCPGLDRFKGPMFHSAHWDAIRPGREARRGDRHRRERDPVRPADRPQGRADDDLPAFRAVGARKDGPRVPRAREAPPPALPVLPSSGDGGGGCGSRRSCPIFARPESPAGRATRRSTRTMSQVNRFMQLRGDRRLWKATTPDSPVGCKRVLITSDWFPTLRRDNVELVTGAITEVAEDGVSTATAVHPADAIVFGTASRRPSSSHRWRSRAAGASARRGRWARGAEAYLGIAVPGFPNMFLLYGPNTNHGAGSAVDVLETQANYAAQAVGLLARGGRAARGAPGGPRRVRARDGRAAGRQRLAGLLELVRQRGGTRHKQLARLALRVQAPHAEGRPVGLLETSGSCTPPAGTGRPGRRPSRPRRRRALRGRSTLEAQSRAPAGCPSTSRGRQSSARR